MGKKYIITENQYNVILEQDNSVITNLYNRVKEKPIVKKIESLLDPDFKTFMNNVVKEFPQLKDKEQSFLSQGLKILSNPEDFIIKNQKEVDKILEEQLVEQAVGKFIISTFGVFFLLLLIYTAKFGKKIVKPENLRKEELSEVNKKLQVFRNKTVNLYNNAAEQILFGTENVVDIEFFDKSKWGGRSGVKFGFGFALQKSGKSGTSIYGNYEIICLSNPARLADFIVREGEYTKDLKYNKKFTDAVGEIAGQYCKAPTADFSVVQKQSNNNMV